MLLALLLISFCQLLYHFSRPPLGLLLRSAHLAIAMVSGILSSQVPPKKPVFLHVRSLGSFITVIVAVSIFTV